MQGARTKPNLVVVPVFNEEETIEAVLAELRRHYSGDVLIVDDGSTDRSAEVVEALGMANLTIIRHSENQGYGAALITGFKFAEEHGHGAVVTMDCDWQHEPSQVPEFFERLGYCDVLSGSRYLDDSPENHNVPADRFHINRLITRRINELFKFGISDAFCGFKAYRIEAIKKLSLSEPGYGFPMQFWVQAYVFGLCVCEIPVARIYLHASRSFGAGLDDPEERLQYYLNVLDEERRKWQLT